MNGEAGLPRLSSGVAGLDEILAGGFLTSQSYLVRGGPGTGKTTLGAHFARAGVQAGERVLWLALSEPAPCIQRNALGMGLDLSGVTFLDLTPGPEFFREHKSYEIFSAAEVELHPLGQKIVGAIEATKPLRVVVDSVTQLQFLTADLHQFHTQVVSLLRSLTTSGATVVLTSEASGRAPDEEVQFLVDGVIELEAQGLDRRLQVKKFRGSSFRGGWHSYRLGESGFQVFPRLDPQARTREFPLEMLSSGIPALDELLHGGLTRGTVTLISGPSGVGKTTLGLQFMKEAASRGEGSVILHFEEAQRTIINRGERVNIPISKMLAQGTLSLQRIEPLQLSADELGSIVRREVEEKGVTMLMLDSVAGYRLSVRGAMWQPRSTTSPSTWGTWA